MTIVINPQICNYPVTSFLPLCSG